MSDFKFDFKIDNQRLAYALTILKNAIMLTIFIYIFLIYFYESKIYYENNTENEIEPNKFLEQFPILDELTNKKNIYPSNKELLFEKILYIKDSFLTKEYIQFIRPKSEVEDQFYQETSYENLEIKDKFDMNREGQINLINYNNINSIGKLIDQKRYTIWECPFVSIIIPFYNQGKEIIKTIRSIQNQSLKNIEIIIVDDNSTDTTSNLYYKYFLKTDPRIRVFYHLKHMGEWRSRLDGFLYSKGRYIIQYSSSSLFIDNTALEDIYYIASKYKIDSLRFTYQKTNGDIIGNSNYRKEYSNKDYRIHYGKCDYNSYFFEYGYLGNRIVRSSIITKTLGKTSPMILNAYKNLWTDAWWNQIGNIIDTTYASIYRDVFLYFESKNNEIISSLDQNKELTIREFIYFWIFTYEALPRNNNKKELILEMKSFTDPKNMVKGKKVTLNYLKSYFDEYEYLLRNLIKDEYISDDDKQFVTGLLSDYEKIKK